MTQLERNALARDVLIPPVVLEIYRRPLHASRGAIMRLCESHEKLRAEVSGAAAVIADLEAKLAACHALLAETFDAEIHRDSCAILRNMPCNCITGQIQAALGKERAE